MVCKLYLNKPVLKRCCIPCLPVTTKSAVKSSIHCKMDAMKNAVFDVLRVTLRFGTLISGIMAMAAKILLHPVYPSPCEVHDGQWHLKKKVLLC